MTTNIKPTVALIKASLPTYFPDEFGVFDNAEAELGRLEDSLGFSLHVESEIPMDGRQTIACLDRCRAAGADFVLLLHGGFTMGDVARAVAASGMRAGFWATPEPVREGDVKLNNYVSLNMSLSIARRVRDLGEAPVQWYFGAPGSSLFFDRFSATVSALQAIKMLEGARIGVVGGLAQTFYNMEVSTNALHERLGVDVVYHDMDEFTSRLDGLDDNRVSAECSAMLQAARADGVTDDHMMMSACMALALHDMATDGDYKALAVSDWPRLQEYPGLHPGAAFTWAEEKYDLPIASEGDVLGSVSQLVGLSLAGRPGYLLDTTDPDTEDGSLLMWHGGGGPLYLADENGARWINHPMLGRSDPEGARFGAISDLVFRDGPITAFRVGENAGALFTMQARVEERTPTGFTGCRGWVRDFDIAGEPASILDVVQTTMTHGLEHHFILVPGHHSAALIEFASWTGQRLLKRVPYTPYLAAEPFEQNEH
ncbi:MAG: hypothetical protein AAF414_05345 [Pseudomonadota bacterium]